MINLYSIQIVEELEEFGSYDEWESQQLETSHKKNFEISEKENNDMISTISETATVNKIELQEELYNNEEKEEKKIDTQKTIQRQMKKIFRQCKFPSDTKNQFYKPNFVTSNMNGEKSQTVQICKWIWEKIGIVYI